MVCGHVIKAISYSLGVFVWLALAELAVRCLPAGFAPEVKARKCLEYRPGVGVVTIQPASTLVHISPLGCNSIRYNACGFRGPSRPLEKDSGEIRIAVLGDSYIEGREVRDDELSTTRIEQRMGRPVRVMNFGICGTGQAEQIPLYRNLVRRFKPDLVIVCVTLSNDFEDNVKELADNRDRNLLRMENGKLVEIPPSALVRFFCLPAVNPLTHLVTNSALFRLLQRPRVTRPSRKPAVPAPDPLAAFDTPACDNAKAVMSGGLLALRQLVESDGARILLMNASDCMTFLSWEDPAFTKKAEWMNRRYRWLALFARDHGFAHLDLRLALLDHFQLRKLRASDLHISNDGHWTPLAHSLVADAVADYLKGPLGKPLLPPPLVDRQSWNDMRR
ncbi:MAG: GDSL-type esterase/lipase family protein [Acidobacteriota bacterium]|nr:GDSL-type esterase/lipase family protein [Acidobacteriota bacterium]